KSAASASTAAGWHLASRLYRFPQQPLPLDAVSRSHRHLVSAGYLRSGSVPGTFALCPLLCRSLDKLIYLIHDSMSQLGAQRVTLPMLGSAAMWHKTGRWDALGSEMFRLTDREDRQLCLQPTHEEEVTRLVSMTAQLPLRSLPLLVYQLHWKFRDEPRPKYGLLRARDFHADDACARNTYDQVLKLYSSLLGDTLGLPWIRAVASSGCMGGIESCEFHVLTKPGEDRIVRCADCNEPCRNSEGGRIALPNCLSPAACRAEFLTGLEVGHCFILGSDRYPAAFGLRLIDQNHHRQREQRLLSMACYGIGVSRLLAACAEVASTDTALRWPLAVAPYQLAVVSPKAGAREPRLSTETMAELVQALGDAEFNPDAPLVDDRDQLTIGTRIRDHRLWGLPCSLVVKASVDGGISCEFVDNYQPDRQSERATVASAAEAVAIARTFIASISLK
uniref:proline--tRNA ligase n=1 Tax=Macrostomum lignano TaxID=282301 RepID=A0A1I8FS58_9PLAT